MSFRHSCIVALTLLLSLAVLSVEAATFTVSKDGRGQYTTVQAAINKAGPGDIVEILDVANYPEQVTIDSNHNNLTLISANPASLNKPRITWNDRVNVLPKTCADAQVDSLINWDQNGALRLMRAHGVIVNGIAVDGGGNFPFVSTTEVWPATGGSKTSCMYKLQQGNSALDLWISGDAIIKNCDISNAFVGIQVKDRNDGGIFANANPGDNTPWLVVPLSGFARTGNHVIEYNRIHDNSYGLWCESIWDLGSTIRYNLIFNNHDPDSLAKIISGMSPNEGTMMCGGAFLFKDDMYSPFAIYNNTFWHNFLIFEGDWRPGAQHLVFNNIYGSPYHYWTTDPVFKNNESDDISPQLTNRMYNCVYSVQDKPPSTYNAYYTAIMNGINVGVNAANQELQGNLMNTTQGFPATADIRWVEMDTARFLSIDPASTHFLEPNWTDSLVTAYIKNAGWVASGVTNADGSPADLGAIQNDGGKIIDDITIKPTMPLSFTGTAVNLSFDVTQRIGSMTNPKITLLRFVRNLPNQSGSGYGNVKIIPAADIITIPVPATPIIFGLNSLNVTIPASDTSTYSFIELTITGTGSDGKPVSSSVGFIPYRKLDYKFVVQVWNFAKTIQPDTVHAGDTVWVRIIPEKMDNTPFTQIVNPAKMWLQSGANFYVPGTQTAVTLPAGVSPPSIDKAGTFTQVPPGNVEVVHASGQWTSGTNSIVFLGGSKGITILSGPPQKVVFQNPPSNTFKSNPPTVDPGSPFPGTFKVYDNWGNTVNVPAIVTLQSLQSNIGDIVGDPKIDTTDATGTGTFAIFINNGNTGQLFTITGALAGKNTDSADVIVGKPRDKLWIFYGDTTTYAPAATILQGQVGDRLKITVMAGKSAKLDSLTKVSTTFTINGSSGLVFYSSPTATTPATDFTLTNGRVDLWVTSLSAINNGSVSAISDTNLILSSDTRTNIFFIKPLITIDSAFYYADNGLGQVNRAEIYYKDTLIAAPDSIALFWPNRTDADKQLATGAAITVATDKKHVTVKLATPFPAGITTGDTASNLGTTYQKTTTGATADDSARFVIKDRIGPLIMTGQVVERLAAGIDTLNVSFSEGLKPGSLIGASLVLIKTSGTSVDTVTSATLNGSVYKLTLSAGSTPPMRGDSLKINPTGPLADAVGNPANPLNRPVSLTLKSIPASITAAYYQDLNADGTVETVVMKFNKAVSLVDCNIVLDWGDSITSGSIDVSRLAYQGTDSTSIVINTLGVFPKLPPGPRTSGAMNATVIYQSGGEADHAVADSAAPVLVKAVYHPGESISETVKNKDTLTLDFSEPLGTLKAQLSFQAKVMNTAAQTLYSIIVETSALASTGTHRSFLVDSTVIFPSKGDSIWINPLDAVGDTSNAIQVNPNNRRVVLDVLPVPYKWSVKLSKNPFVPGKAITISGISGTGLAIEISPTTTSNNIILSAEGRIYDVMGNLVMDKTVFQKNINNKNLYMVWDGRNKNGRYVGTNTYLAIISVTDENGPHSQKIKIGVTR